MAFKLELLFFQRRCIDPKGGGIGEQIIVLLIDGLHETPLPLILR
jgi:hypothetical protein